jgi:hypothetical protein
VILIPVADFGSKFRGWTGCDSVDEEDGTCTVTMNADRELGANFGAQPVVSEQVASQITDTSARLDASINPRGAATDYRFEYIAEADWLDNGESFSGASPASKTPLVDVSIGSGTTPLAVGEKVEGLEQSTIYHFRAVATNDNGTAFGELDEAHEEVPQTFTTYAAPQIDVDCANQGRRTGPSAALPDCRAYEQASPIDKNGSSIQGKAPLARAGENGDRISFESPVGIPGGTGAQEFPNYVGRRGSSDWSTLGLLPDALSGEGAKLLGWNADFDEAFSSVQKFGQGIGLLAKSTEDGGQQLIVPYTLPSPQYFYVGSSRDGSVVVFQALDTSNTDLKLTPDAAAGEPNVYAWKRGNPGTLRLVGVLPDGTTPPEGSSVEGTLKGVPGEYTRDTHRVTDDGSVYFTDRATGQLYLRRDPFGSPSTVHISAPQRTDCADDPDDCGGDGEPDPAPDAGGSKPATFLSATPDGAHAFFSSSEELTGDSNTTPPLDPVGIARADIGDGGNVNKSLVPLAGASPAGMTTDGEHIYWASPSTDSIGRADLSGGSSDQNFITGADNPQDVAVGGGKIYWTNAGSGGEGGPGTIGRADLNGSGAAGNVSQSCITGATFPHGIDIEGSYAYWTNPESERSDLGSSVGRADISGTCTEANAGANQAFTGVNASNGDITVDSNHIYVSSHLEGLSTFTLIWIYNTADGSGAGPSGGADIELADAIRAPSLALDDSHLYWGAITTAGATIGRSDLDAGDINNSFITGLTAPVGLAVGQAGDAGHLYWATGEVGGARGTDLYHYEAATGDLTDLMPDHADEYGADVQGVLGTSEDGSFVYFAANGVPEGVGNSPNEEGEEAEAGDCQGASNAAAGTCNLYVWHDGAIDFIARLKAGPVGEGDGGDWVNWIRSRTQLLRPESDKAARVSADGGVLFFRSIRPLTDYDNDGPACTANAPGTPRTPGQCAEFYRFSYDGKGLVCVSCEPRGEVPQGNARMGSIRPPAIGADLPAAVLSRNLSADGNRFFFESPDALVAGDVNGEAGCMEWGGGSQRVSSVACQDVYEWEAPGAGSCDEDSSAFSPPNGGCISLISSGTSDEASFFADADLEGENVFLFTYDPLVGQDEDALMDVYDARVGGGMEAQNQVDAAPCSGDACKGQPTAPPSVQAPGSAGFSGPGDSPPSRKQTKKHKKHKKHKHRGHKRRHAAKAKRDGKGQGARKQRSARNGGRAGR